MDVQVLNPLASSHRFLPHSRNMRTLYVMCMASKFMKLSMPLLLPSSCLPLGRLAHEATTFYKHQASFLSSKWSDKSWVGSIAVFASLYYAVHLKCTSFHWSYSRTPWYQVWLEYDKCSQSYLRLFTKNNTNMLSHPQGKPRMAGSWKLVQR